jgi:hypothetical protein
MIVGGAGTKMLMPTTNDASASGLVHDAPIDNAPANGGDDDDNEDNDRRGREAVVTTGEEYNYLASMAYIGLLRGRAAVVLVRGEASAKVWGRWSRANLQE